MKGSIRQQGTTWTVYWFTTGPGNGEAAAALEGRLRTQGAGEASQGDSAREYFNSVVGKVQDGSWRKDSPLTVKDCWKTIGSPLSASKAFDPRH